MRGIVSLSFVVGALLGCHAQQADLKQDVCEVACRCEFALPGEQAECVPDCVKGLDTVTDDCSDCVFENENSCATVDSLCLQKCEPPPPPPTNGGN